MDRSGLPDDHLAIVGAGSGDDSVRAVRRIEECDVDRTLRSLRAMTLVVLAIICFLASLFLLYALFQWMRDTERKVATRLEAGDEVGGTGERKGPRIVVSPAASGRPDRSTIQSRQSASATTLSDRSGRELTEYEHIAYEKIAKSLRLPKRS